MAVVQWLLENKAVSTMYFAGFSFGGYIAAKSAHLTQEHTAIEVKHLLMIAPSVVNSPFENVTPISLDTTIIMGDADDVVSYQDVHQWTEQQYPPLELITMEGAGHFFHGRLTELVRVIHGIFHGQKLG